MTSKEMVKKIARFLSEKKAKEDVYKRQVGTRSQQKVSGRGAAQQQRDRRGLGRQQKKRWAGGRARGAQADGPMKHANVSVFVPHAGCQHQCSFCDQRAISGAQAAPDGAAVACLLYTSRCV